MPRTRERRRRDRRFPLRKRHGRAEVSSSSTAAAGVESGCQALPRKTLAESPYGEWVPRSFTTTRCGCLGIALMTPGSCRGRPV